MRKIIVIFLMLIGIVFIGSGIYLSFNNNNSKEIYEIESSSDELVYKYDKQDLTKISIGSTIFVDEGESLVFVQNNEATDVWGAGTYEVSNKNITLVSKSDLYYVDLKEIVDEKWGTSEIKVIDLKVGEGYMSAYGLYTYKVIEPKEFINKILRSTDDNTNISNFVREYLIEGVITTVGNLGKIDVALIPAMVKEIEIDTIEFVKNSNIGIDITNVQIQSINATDEFQNSINEYYEEQINKEFKKTFEANCYFLTKEEGGRHTPFFSGLEVKIEISEQTVDATINMLGNEEMVMPGDTVDLSFVLASQHEVIKGQKFNIFQGDKLIGRGKVN